MFKLINVLLFVTIVIALLEASNCVCPEEGQPSPVCGTDGKTYFNRENLLCYKRYDKSHLSIVAEEPCRCPCGNTKEFLPVCASDGNTYSNPGEVKCHNMCYKKSIQILSYRPCHNGTRKRVPGKKQVLF